MSRYSLVRAMLFGLCFSSFVRADIPVLNPISPGSINAQRLQPALGPENLWTVEGSITSGQWKPMVQWMMDYAYRPLYVTDGYTQAQGTYVPHMLTGHLMGGVGFTNWFQVGLAIPVVLYQGSPDTMLPGSDLFWKRPSPSPTGIGDLRLIAKFRVIDNRDHGIGFALSSQIIFPSGNAEEFRGSGSFGIEPKAILDYRFPEGSFLAANVSFLAVSRDQVLFGTQVSHQIRYGLGGCYYPLSILGLYTELAGGTSIHARENLFSMLEVSVGVRVQLKRSWGLRVDVGGSVPLISVPGSAYRVFAGLSWVPMKERKARPLPAPTPEKETAGEAPAVEVEEEAPVPGKAEVPPSKAGKPKGAKPEPLSAGKPQAAKPEPVTAEEPLDPDEDGFVGSSDQCPYEPAPKSKNGCPAKRDYILVLKDKIQPHVEVTFAENKDIILGFASVKLLNEVIDAMHRRPTMKILIRSHTRTEKKESDNQAMSRRRARAVAEYLIVAGIPRSRVLSEGVGTKLPQIEADQGKARVLSQQTEFLILEP